MNNNIKEIIHSGNLQYISGEEFVNANAKCQQQHTMERLAKGSALGCCSSGFFSKYI